MDEAWERAVEAALQAAGEGSSSPARSLTLDGAVKCLHGRLPAAEILERYQSLENLSIAGVGVASLAGFPRLRNLTRLTLSDNRIAGGLDHLVAAGLGSLRDLDLSNNRIQYVDDLAPLANLRLVSLDLYECPVTRVKDYRSKVFGMIRTLRYLDKMDADENERPESDDDDDDGDGEGEGDGEDDDDDDDDDEDPGSGEVANGGVSHSRGGSGVHPLEVNGVIDMDEDESDADEVDLPNGGTEHHHLTNGFRVAAVGGSADEDEYVEEEDDDDYEEDDLGEEIDEDGDDDDAVIEVHDVASSDDEDGIEEDGDEEEDEEEVEDDGEEAEPESSGRIAMVSGDVGEEIDGHEQGEGEDDDENGEIGEEDGDILEDHRVYEDGNDDEDEDDVDDEDEGTEYLVQPIALPQAVAIGSDFDAAEADDADEDRDEVDDDDGGGMDVPSSSQGAKRKKGDDPSGSGDDEGDDGVEGMRPFKHH
ncbi:hypothetical protein GUJ93_ZPchr0007g5884 [Zizania palustris]|uniref:Acidic leucine-rich nuclear phosphoprotein 32-related protein n=1 Tax=Zizania palustris TaxID=103762 RepID=A0A8J5T594_ZIZPA|nr:hypothetical protein GUJ93_ZPchr0007g5884 [Zizania palustris]